MRPLGGGLPDVQTGPDPLQPPEATSRAFGVGAGWQATTEQQGTALAGVGLGQHGVQNRQGLPMDLDLRWRDGDHEGYLGPVPHSARPP